MMKSSQRLRAAQLRRMNERCDALPTCLWKPEDIKRLKEGQAKINARFGSIEINRIGARPAPRTNRHQEELDDLRRWLRSGEVPAWYRDWSDAMAGVPLGNP
jgi:hypothetical protein